MINHTTLINLSKVCPPLCGEGRERRVLEVIEQSQEVGATQ